jgi:sensor histidine kinase regulating citrate/malate metabolism
VVCAEPGAKGEVRLKLFLKVLFGLIFAFMVVMTIRASLKQSLWQAHPAFVAGLFRQRAA